MDDLLIDQYLQQAGAHFRAGDYQRAIDLYMQVLAIWDDAYQARHNLAIAYGIVGHDAQAVTEYTKSAGQAPDEHKGQMYFNFGTYYFNRGEYADAATQYLLAIQHRSGFYEALLNLGICLINIGQLDDAIQIFSLARESRHTPTVVNSIGICLSMKHQLTAAAQVFDAGFKDFPDSSVLAGNLYGVAKRLCDWDTIDQTAPRLDAFTRHELAQGTKPGETPFMGISRIQDPETLHRLATAYSDHIFPTGIPPLYSKRTRASTQKLLKVGFVSADFRKHVMAYHMLTYFQHSDRSKYETYAYSYGPDDGSSYRSRIKSSSDRFVDIRRMSDAAAAERIAADGIDILVELAGYTERHRMGIAAFRPAPIQVNYLGYPGTIGSSLFDYIVADEWLIPDEDTEHYSEAVVHLPYGYQLPPYLEATSRQFNRHDEGLPEQAFVMAAFHRGFKVSRAIFGAWMELLHAIPESVLWLPDEDAVIRERFVTIASELGVDPERLVFADQLPVHEHAARLHLADIALDTPVYNGGSTTALMLMAGVPCVTVSGAHYASRMSLSMLKTIGLPELVANDMDGYVALVLRLASDPLLLEQMKERVRQGVQASHIFDPEVKVRAMEQAFATMWEQYVAGKKPIMLSVNEATH